MINLNRKKIVLAIIFSLFLISSVIGVFYYFQYRERKIFRQQAEQTVNAYCSMTPESAGFEKMADELGALLRDSNVVNSLNLRELGNLKIAYADALSEIDPVEGHMILKELAADSRYPNDVRYRAINFIINDYEMAPDYEYAKKYIFTEEPCKNFLQGDDIELAMRCLNEWSDELFPNVIANYRIAKWHASQIYMDPSLPSHQRAEILEAMDERLTKADELFSQYKNRMSNRTIGLAYELKARTIYMAGEPGHKEKAKELFDESTKALIAPPRSAFQMVYLTRSTFYRIAFFAREYGDSQTEITNIKINLKHFSDYLEAPPEPPGRRNIRMVKFLIAARDSTDLKYPSPDFNQEDIKNLSRIDERFGKVIENLNYWEYIKGHPIEKYYEKYGKFGK